MSTFAKPLLAFAHSALVTNPRCESFCFGTRLTRVSDALRTGDVNLAVAAASDQVGDWDGGTRIGEALVTLLDTFGRKATLRGAVIVVCSDGLDAGDPSLVSEQMARLKRISHRIVWINPAKGVDGYQPLARGMSAALPFVDRFAAGDSLADLADLAAAIAKMTARSDPIASSGTLSQ